MISFKKMCFIFVKIRVNKNFKFVWNLNNCFLSGTFVEAKNVFDFVKSKNLFHPRRRYLSFWELEELICALYYYKYWKDVTCEKYIIKKGYIIWDDINEILNLTTNKSGSPFDILMVSNP